MNLIARKIVFISFTISLSHNRRKMFHLSRTFIHDFGDQKCFLEIVPNYFKRQKNKQNKDYYQCYVHVLSRSFLIYYD